MNRNLIGAIEAGGTKFHCAVGTDPRSLQSRKQFPTGADPKRLIAEVANWFREQESAHGKLAALGIASFGPVDLRRDSPTYGYITSTPKPGWKNFDLVGSLRSALGDLPIGFDTDVNGAGLGERDCGAAVGLDDFVYITVGTGVGAGGMSGGNLLHGLVHPEMGHIRLPRVAGDDYAGCCPFHGDCWEGLCSGTAMKDRTGVDATELPSDHPAWRLHTQYMAYAIANLVCVLSPDRVIVGGSVRKAGKLGEAAFFRDVREKVRDSLNGYVAHSSLTDDLDPFIVPPKLGDDAGVCGAIALGLQALGTTS